MWTWIKSALGFGGCDHEWFDLRPSDGQLLRVCSHCLRLEKFEPDCGGNTSGHWDEVK
jgi:hypothetical protein